MNHNDVSKSNNAVDMNEVEMIFGTPNFPKQVAPDVHHMITNEKKHGKETHFPLRKLFQSCNYTNNYDLWKNFRNNNSSHPNNNKDVTDQDLDTVQTQPLLEPDRERQKPPLAGPEVDDLDGDLPRDSAPYPGIDDGLLDPEDKTPEGHDNNGADEHKSEDDDFHEGGHTMADGNWSKANGLDEVDFGEHDAVNGFGNRFDDRPISPMVPGMIIPNVNTYQQKKNLAQGMMDLALLSANANQLRYVLESSANHPYFYPSLTFISLSIILQVAVGIGLILNSRYDVNEEKEICKADKINNMTVIGVFLVTIVNVFITSFSVATPNMQPPAQTAVQLGG